MEKLKFFKTRNVQSPERGTELSAGVDMYIPVDLSLNELSAIQPIKGQVEVKVNPIDANNVIGHKKENIKKLKEYYDVDLILKQDESIKQGKSKIEVTKTFKDFAYEEKEQAKKSLSKK